MKKIFYFLIIFSPNLVFAADVSFMLEFWQVFAGVATGLVIALLLVAVVSIFAAMLLGGLNLITGKNK